MFSKEIEIFIRDYVKDLNEGSASVFAGAGLSLDSGFVSWKDLMKEIAEDLGLDISSETDLISIAQYHVNEHQNRTKITRKILEEFIEGTVETENHRILSRLPLTSIWTTNYDNLIEEAFKKADKIVDVKYTEEQLLTTKPKRDVVVFKMHGDANHPTKAILTKQQYEFYHRTHESFINALTGELTTKTFLFLGFSFSDPNLDYVLSRIHYRYRENKRQHYCFVKKNALGDNNNPDEATFEYNKIKQSLIINDLKRYGIKTLLIDEYTDITKILIEIERRFKKRTIFISGSAEIYDPVEKNEALGFVHTLTKKLVENDLIVVNGFGWGIGSSIINGALEAIQSKPSRYSESQLILKPFPQFDSGNKKLPQLWEEYRNKIIPLSGISIFLFGNKLNGNNIINADGVIREFEISHQLGNFCIPLAFTGSAAETIYNLIIEKPEDYYENPEIILSYLKELSDPTKTMKQRIDIILKLIKNVNR